MAATGADSLSDSVATMVVLLSMGVSWLFKVNIDGWAGAAVAVFILFAGYGVAKTHSRRCSVRRPIRSLSKASRR